MTTALIELLAAIVLLIGAIIALATEIRRWRRRRIERRERPSTEHPTSGGNNKKPWFLIGSSLLLAVAVVFFILASSTYKAASYEDTSTYGFETGTMGWVPQPYIDSQGVVDVAQSTDRAKLGRHSLKLSVDLEGGHPNRSKGEAYVTIPVQNLEGRPITVWVYVPREALGDPQNPNGIQVFVKDNDRSWRSEYGTWWDIIPGRVDSWQQVTLTPGRSAPLDGYMAPGFDPTQIRAVGVKVAIGEKSVAKYRGPIYMDAVDWPK